MLVRKFMLDFLNVLEQMLEQLPPAPKKNLRDSYPHAPPEAVDLIEKLLQFSPTNRYSAEQALSICEEV